MLWRTEKGAVFRIGCQGKHGPQTINIHCVIGQTRKRERERERERKKERKKEGRKKERKKIKKERKERKERKKERKKGKKDRKILGKLVFCHQKWNSSGSVSACQLITNASPDQRLSVAHQFKLHVQLQKPGARPGLPKPTENLEEPLPPVSLSPRPTPRRRGLCGCGRWSPRCRRPWRWRSSPRLWRSKWRGCRPPRSCGAISAGDRATGRRGDAYCTGWLGGWVFVGRRACCLLFFYFGKRGMCFMSCFE